MERPLAPLTEPERSVYRGFEVAAAAVTILPFLAQASRVLDLGLPSFIEVPMQLSTFLLPVAPVVLLGGFAYLGALYRAVAARGARLSLLPLATELAVYAAVWAFTIWTFRQLPLFAGGG